MSRIQFSRRRGPAAWLGWTRCAEYKMTVRFAHGCCRRRDRNLVQDRADMDNAIVLGRDLRA